jgi:hypothetical protein
MEQPDFFLASTESYNLQEPREVFILKILHGTYRDDFMLVKIEPPIIGQRYGLGGKDISEVVIVSRHESESLLNIKDWPMSVHVARPLVDDLKKKNSLDEKEIELIAWAEIYKTEEDAMKAKSE